MLSLQHISGLARQHRIWGRGSYSSKILKGHSGVQSRRALEAAQLQSQSQQPPSSHRPMCSLVHLCPD